MQVGWILKTALCAGILSVPAFSAVVIDFSGSNGGTITGNTCTVSGTCTGSGDLTITSVLGVSTPQNNGTSESVSGGDFHYSVTGGTFSSGVYTYTAGTFQITGTIPGIPGTGNPLETGTISSLIVNLNTGTLNLVVSGPDTKDATLVSFYCNTCLTTGWYLTGGHSQLNNVSLTSPNGYSAQTFSTDLPNDYVPEPASIVLLGTIVVGITQSIRRRGHKTTA